MPRACPMLVVTCGSCSWPGGRGELTARAWARIEPLRPPVAGRGGSWRGHRQVINAILVEAADRGPWRDLPERVPVEYRT
jgi:transposase